MILWGMGISQSTHGTDNTRCLIALAAALRPGRPAGHRPAPAARPEQRAGRLRCRADPDDVPGLPPHRRRRGARPAGAAVGRDARPEPGLTVVEIMHAAERGEIRGMYIMGENPAMSDPDLAHARAALARLDHLVVQDLFLTETAALADVVLPASAWPEKDGTVTNTNRQVQMGRAAVPLPGEARQDLEIIVELARRLGLHWSYAHPREVFAEMAEAMPSPRQHHLGPAGARGQRHLSLRRARRAGRGDRLRRPLPHRERPRPLRPRRPDRPGGDAGRAIPLRAHHRPATGALAHRHHDPPRRRAGRAGAGADRLPGARRAGAARPRAGRSACAWRPGAAPSSSPPAPIPACRRGRSSCPSPSARRRRTC